MTRRLLLVCLLAAALFASVPAGAEMATREEARMVAENWAAYIGRDTGGWAGVQDARVSSVEEIASGDTVLGWCMQMSPSGHVIVPSLKEMPPVKAYSDVYGADMAEPEGYARLIREVLSDRARRFVSEYGSMEATEPERGGSLLGVEHRAEWDRFAVEPSDFAMTLGRGALEPLTEVGPLLTTAWHQGSPYNNLCPMGDGGRTVVGCVATASAQILRYHSSPSEGFGSHCYYWSGDSSCGGNTSGSTLCADYDDPYDWTNMPNSCSGGCSTTEQDAVAELCYEVGVAFDMSYGRCGSGAYTADALYVFPTYFGYSSSIDRENRPAHSPSSWFNLIKEEINADRPIQYRILSHSIVCDGWRDTGGTQQYHMNYGWADSHNAWYVLDDLYNPNPDGDTGDEYMIRRIMPPDPAWEDVTDGFPVGDTGDGMGVSWVDYDGDNDLDLYVTNDGTANVLSRNDGALGFADATSGPLADAGAGAAAVWGDYDNDGDPDLYIVNTGTSNRLVRNDGGGTFTDVTSGPLGDTGDGYGAAWVDHDNDGDLDIYIVNDGGANVLLDNDAGTFTDVATPPVNDAAAGRGAAWADYDGDGDQDVYIANYGASNRLLRNDGGGAFTDVTTGQLGDTGNATGVAWADYDNDGDQDIYVANYGSANLLLRNDGGVFADATSSPLDDAGNGTGVAWGDYDNDGDLDVYLVNDGASNRLFRNLGSDVFIDVTTSPLDDAGQGQGVAWGDYDRDGRVDLAIANRNGGNLLLAGRVASTSHFLNVRLEGTESNASAVGASVRLVTADATQTREVSGGSGYLSQDSAELEFGLGLNTVVDSLVIAWPSGLVNRYQDLASGQFLTFTEMPPPSPPASLALTPIEAGVSLSWASVTDPQLDHYRIERDTTAAFGTGTVEFTASDTSYVDFPLVDVREYFYRVFAAGTGGNESSPGPVESAYPQQTPPDAPTSLTAVAGDAQVELTWTGATAPDLDHYLIERDTTALFSDPVQLVADWEELTDGPLAADQYYYRVFSVDWGGMTSASGETVACSPLVVAPSRPQGLLAESEDGAIALEWDVNPEIDIAGYIVHRDTLATMSSPDSLAYTSSTYFNDSPVENYRVYWYSVQAVDTGGLRSVPSDTIAGVGATGGAVFVECGGGSGYENGSSTYPFNELSEGIAAAGDGTIVLVLPGSCSGGLVLDQSVMVVGVGGAANTSIVSMSGSVMTAAAGSDSAVLQGLTLDGMGSASAALECDGSDIEVTDCVLTNAVSALDAHSGAAPELLRTAFTNSNQGINCSDTASPRVSSSTFAGNANSSVQNYGDPGPVIGGSPDSACDFYDTAYFRIFNMSSATVSAQLNFWGDTCVDSTWFYGPCDYVPWTDSLHVATYTECPGTGAQEGFPTAFSLGRNFPNPFNPVTRIAYAVPLPGGEISLSVYSVSGRLVRSIVDGHVEPGRHLAVWDGKDERGKSAASGIYFYRLEAPDFSEQRKMVLLK